jgi:hypothetical protein
LNLTKKDFKIPAHICLDKRFPVWFMGKIINFKRGPDYEKDINGVQQHEEEANPWLPRPDGHQRRPAGPQQAAGEGTEKTGGVTPRLLPKAGRGGPGKGAV